MGFESFNHSVSGTMGSTINSTYVPMDGNGIVIPPAADGGHFNLPGYAPFGEVEATHGLCKKYDNKVFLNHFL